MVRRVNCMLLSELYRKTLQAGEIKKKEGNNYIISAMIKKTHTDELLYLFLHNVNYNVSRKAQQYNAQYHNNLNKQWKKLHTGSTAHIYNLGLHITRYCGWSNLKYDSIISKESWVKYCHLVTYERIKPSVFS